MVSSCEWSLEQGSLKSLVADSYGMDQYLHFGSRKVPVLAGINLLESHDFSFRRKEFLVYDAEGHARSVPLRRSPSGHRILNLLL